MLFSIAQNLTVSGVTVLISNRIHEFLAHLTATLKIAIDYVAYEIPTPIGLRRSALLTWFKSGE